MTFVIPVKTVTEGNSKEHWRTKANRAKVQRGAASFVANCATSKYRASKDFRGWPPVIVHLTRVAPSDGLDGHDNLRGAVKHVVDGIADVLGIDDGDEARVEWRYAQRRGKPREYAVEVRIEAKG